MGNPKEEPEVDAPPTAEPAWHDLVRKQVAAAEKDGGQEDGWVNIGGGVELADSQQSVRRAARGMLFLD
jgi:hypothetical protein